MKNSEEIKFKCEPTVLNVLMSRVKKYSYYMPAGSKTNLGGSCICYKE